MSMRCRSGYRERYRRAVHLQLARRLAGSDAPRADGKSDRIGATRQTIIAIEQGKYSPTLEMAFKIARVFNVPLDDVFQYPNEVRSATI